MRKQNLKAQISRMMMTVDKPTMALSGAVIGFLLVGIIFMTLGALIESPEGQLWNGKELLGGLACVGVSIVLTAIIFAYWNLIVKRKGIVAPALMGLGWILAILGLCSGIMLGVELAGWITYRL